MGNVSRAWRTRLSGVGIRETTQHCAGARLPDALPLPLPWTGHILSNARGAAPGSHGGALRGDRPVRRLRVQPQRQRLRRCCGPCSAGA